VSSRRLKRFSYPVAVLRVAGTAAAASWRQPAGQELVGRVSAGRGLDAGSDAAAAQRDHRVEQQ